MKPSARPQRPEHLVVAYDRAVVSSLIIRPARVQDVAQAALWVADPNPRAQAFYRKHGFAADGTARSEDGVREIRMVRGV